MPAVGKCHQLLDSTAVDRQHDLDRWQHWELDIGDIQLGTVGMIASHTELQDMDRNTVAVPWCSWEEVHQPSLEELEQKL